MDCANCPVIRTLWKDRREALIAARLLQRDFERWLAKPVPEDEKGRQERETAIEGIKIKLARASHERDYCASLLELTKEAEIHEQDQ